jgi:hypothetical protein
MQILGISNVDLMDDSMDIIKELLSTSKNKTISEFSSHYEEISKNSEKYIQMIGVMGR